MTDSEHGPEHELTARLIARIRQGDQKASADLVNKFSRGLRFLLRRHTRDPSLVEDFLQETWAIALTKIRSEGLAEPEKLAGYLCGIANNLVRSESRRVHRQRTSIDSEIIELIPDESDNPYRQCKRADVARLVQELLDELTQDRDRDILQSFYVRDEDKESICSRLGVDSTHFNRVLHRARQRMKEAAQRNAMRSSLHVVD